MKDKAFIALSGLFFLLFFITIISLTINQPITNILKAKNIAPSPLKSFGVVFPQIGTIGDSSLGRQPTKVKVSIYIRGVDGSILPNRTVKLASSLATVKIEPSDTASTNNIGQAEFYISSPDVGKIKLSAIELASNTEVINIPTVEFVQ